MKPGWLLDIDGVINALGVTDFQARWPDDEWKMHNLGPGKTQYPFRASPSVCDFIIEMHDAGVEIRWHTTWQAGAQVAADYLGLPTFGIQPAPEFEDFRYRNGTGPEVWWKAPSVRRLLEEDPERPWIWTDDDIRWCLSTDDKLFKDACHVDGTKIPGTIASAKHLFISPEDRYGLDPTHLALIRGFVMGNS